MLALSSQELPHNIVDALVAYDHNSDAILIGITVNVDGSYFRVKRAISRIEFHAAVDPSIIIQQTIKQCLKELE